MAVKQVFETYVYAYLLSSSAKPPFVLGRICLIKGGDIFGVGLLAIQPVRTVRQTEARPSRASPLPQFQA
ncbi:MAG: hypothetical protein J6A65_20095, partial [Pseudomonas sp.]|nr:hypothetical protein [Pseudomonas sp.]